jgi:acyl-coenzyme A thioesterase PaaI-like protein
MPFDPVELVEKFEKAAPSLSRKFSMLALGFISPFNSHLKGKLKAWGKNKVKIELACHRGVKNHVGSIHAGALFTLGETCAGLIIIRNFSFKEHRPLMSEVSVVYDKQALEGVTGVCEVTAGVLDKAKATLKKGEIPFIPMKTLIFNGKGQKIAEVNTKWQVKPWKKVKIKN